jgi:hypothetical protein|tara:strand:+ start:555 stop:1043 length:489 start_codon:yes stop_codon:yes gene_type:complete
MNYLKISIGIFAVLAASRFIPHPPNFTSLIALSFYVPVLLGLRYLPSLIICFIITDLVIGFHGLTFFTWGSVIVIGLISKFFTYNIYYRFFGALLGACTFFLITNFGVWLLGSYGYSLNGLLTTYWFAIPFFGNTIISTILHAILIEFVYKIFFKDKIIKLN